MQVSTLLFFWLPVFFFSVLLVKNTLPYFTFNKNFGFILERSILFQKPIYNFCFYLHIAAGMFCIMAALLQFSSTILKKRKKIHVWSGRIYVFVVLLLGAPTGLYMAFFAKGSLAEVGLFVFMALSWFYFTAQGLAAALKKNIVLHKMWMIRSYAMALTAVTFRIYHLLFYSAGWNALENYELSLWISVLGNILIAEIIIRTQSKNYLHSFQSVQQ